MKRIISVLLILLFAAACANAPAHTVDEYPASADVQPVALGFDVPEIECYDDFACALSAALLDGTENRNFSPVSAYFALAMAAEGANGETQATLLRFLGCGSIEQLRDTTANMRQALTRETETGELSLCNSLWMGEVFPVKKNYRERLAELYGAEADTVRFGTDDAGKRIAGWIEDKTNGLLSPAPDAMEFDELTICVLLNTVYFRDQWWWPFGDPKPGTFTLADGTTEEVDYLHRREEGTIHRGEGFMRYSVRYESKGKITFVLPDEGTALKDLLGTPDRLQALLSGGERIEADVDLLLPKFAFRDRFELADVLCALGLADAFKDGADFSGMTDVKTRLDRVIQETVVDLNEEGTEAAAYTEVLPAPGEAAPDTEPTPRPLVEFHLNRPFLFVISGPGGTALFIGTVTSPTPAH